MKIRIEDKDFYYNHITNFIFDKVVNSNFLFSKKKYLDLGYIKWIYEKRLDLYTTKIFPEEEFFAVKIYKKYSDEGFYITSDISYDRYGFLTVKIYIFNLENFINKGDIDIVGKRHILHSIASSMHNLTNRYPLSFDFDYKVYKQNIYNYIFTREELVSITIGLRAEYLYYKVNYLECIKTFLNFKKNRYSLSDADYNMITLDLQGFN
jgi:hypothetical protein